MNEWWINWIQVSEVKKISQNFLFVKSYHFEHKVSHLVTWDEKRGYHEVNIPLVNRPWNDFPSGLSAEEELWFQIKIWDTLQSQLSELKVKKVCDCFTALHAHSGVPVLLHVVKPAVEIPTISLLLDRAKINSPETQLTATQVNIWQHAAGKALQLHNLFPHKLGLELFWCPEVILWLIKKKMLQYCSFTHIKH